MATDQTLRADILGGPRLNLGCGPIQPLGWVNIDGSNPAFMATRCNWLENLLVRLGLIEATEFTKKTTKPLKVLQFICPAGMFGAEMWILALAKGLDPERVDCRLAVTRESDEQNLEVYHRFKALGRPAYRIAMRGRFDPLGILSLVRLIRKERIDIIHTHGYKSDILGLIAARMAGIRALATPHGFENAKDFKLQTFIRLGCAMLRHFDRVTPLSEDLEKDMRRIGVDSPRIRLIRNGVDLSEIEGVLQRPATGVFSDEGFRRIGYVGQIAHRKNLNAMIRAFDLLRRRHPDTRLVLVGDGPTRKEMEGLARDLGCVDAVLFMGYRKDRLDIVRELDIFSMTSSLEGIPRCMMEAMALGVPVAAFDIPGVDQLVKHEKTGLLAHFGDVEALVECWARLLGDAAYARQLGEAGRRHVTAHFSARRMAREYQGLYEEMAKFQNTRNTKAGSSAVI